MKKQHISALFVTMAMIIGSSLPAQAGLGARLKSMIPGFSDRGKTVIITGNYIKPRLLAELIQAKRGNPVLLTASADAGAKLYYLPYEEGAATIEAADCIEFIDLLKPQRLVFIGGTNYIAAETLELLADRYPAIRVDGKNWARNSEALGTLFKYKKLPIDFAEMLQEAEKIQNAPTEFVVPADAPVLPPVATPAQ